MKRLFLCPLLLLLCSPPVSAILDTNNNGMSDIWERIYNNGDLFPSSFDPLDDDDSDGWTNAEEAVAGTDPNSSESPDGMVRPEVAIIHDVSLDLDNDGIAESYVEVATITWPIIAGKQYTLLHSPDMTEGSWTQVQQAPATADGTRTSYFPVTASVEKMFWRVKIEDVDSDGDGLTDAEEYKLGTDPLNAQTLDGISDLWLARYFTNTLLAGGLNTIDPNAYANTDGYTIVQEAYLNLDPNTPHTPPTGPIGQQCIVNGDFSNPVIGSSPSNTSDPTWDYWGLGAVSGWSAVVGTNIEFQNITHDETGNQYVELKAEPEGHYGIKQEVGTLKGATYLLALDCRDREDVGPECSNFNVLIDNEVKCKISFTDFTETDPLTIFVFHGRWKTVTLLFTANNPTTWISLVPVITPNDTTGCLVDNVKLAPVGIKVVKKGESTTPEDGLIVTKGETVVLSLSDTPQTDFPIAKDMLVWKYRLMNGNGQFPTTWTEYGEQGQGVSFEDVTDASGIFQVRATVTISSESIDFYFKRCKDEKEGGSDTQTMTGDLDAYGVVDTEIQKSIVHEAKRNLGSIEYALDADFPPLYKDDSKCNLFVAHKATDAGAIVPWINWSYRHWCAYPPTANQWAGTENDGKIIPNWTLLDTTELPQPGFIVAFPRIGTSGHVGILDYDGVGIGAGGEKVSKRFDFYETTASKDGLTRHRKYSP